MTNLIKIPAFQIIQNDISFYSCVIDVQLLSKICSTNIDNFDDDDVVYQRKLNLRRIESIARYVSFPKGILPTSVVLNSCKKINYENGALTIDMQSDKFFIIDGQHRIFGAAKAQKSFPMNVIIMDSVEIDYQSELFLLINNEQKRVNSIVRFNMMAHDKVKTPEKVIRQIAYYLNVDQRSPFYQMIRFDDDWSSSLNSKISLSTFAEPLVNMIYNSYDHYMIKRELERLECFEKVNDRLSFLNLKYSKKIFWKLYVNDQESLLYKFIYNYYSAFKNVFAVAWNNSKYILCKTTGYAAISMLFKDIFVQCSYNKDFSINKIIEIIKPLNRLEKDLIVDNYGLGKVGAYDLYRDFKKQLNLNISDIDFSLLNELELVDDENYD